MRYGLVSALLFAGITVFAGAIPSQINYQGALKESGVPVNGTRTMLFRLTNADGSAVYWSSGNTAVTVTQGLFSTLLSPTGVDWQNVMPFVEVSVEGQLLLPREPVASTVYAYLSNSVVDGSITLPKLDSTVQADLVPFGLIGMFSGNCPSGWTRFTALDNMFPMGGPTYGTAGGAASHSHVLGGPTTTAAGFIFTSGQGSGSAFSDWGRADHHHSVSTESNLPPFVTMVFCQKQ